MVWLANLEREGLVFTWALFGVQHDELTETKKQIIMELHKLLTASAGRVDCLREATHEPASTLPRTTTFVAYWLDRQDYQSWWTSPPVQDFWNGLPDNAGVWREVLTVPKSRYTLDSSQPTPRGLGSLLGMAHSFDEGYWGVFRHRLSETRDSYTNPDDTFSSPLVTKTKVKPDSTKKVVDLEQTFSGKIRLGSVKLKSLPDNLVFLRESQSQPNLEQDEIETWLTEMGPYARSWMDHLNTARNKNGVVSFAFHVVSEVPEHAMKEDPTSNSVVDHVSGCKQVPETNQLMYFLDLAHFELAGRSFKDHVTLRDNSNKAYGPGGKHSNGGKLAIAGELCVLKSEDIEAEYIGCKEGTGLMALENL